MDSTLISIVAAKYIQDRMHEATAAPRRREAPHVPKARAGRRRRGRAARAEANRAATASAHRRAGRTYQSERAGPILIRYSGDGDRIALQRLAQLDSRRLPGGSFLLAEIDGELVAAAPLDADDEPLSDPFRHTADVRELLRLRACQVRGSQRALARPVGAAPRALPDAA